LSSILTDLRSMRSHSIFHVESGEFAGVAKQLSGQDLTMQEDGGSERIVPGAGVARRSRCLSSCSCLTKSGSTRLSSGIIFDQREYTEPKDRQVHCWVVKWRSRVWAPRCDVSCVIHVTSFESTAQVAVQECMRSSSSYLQPFPHSLVIAPLQYLQLTAIHHRICATRFRITAEPRPRRIVSLTYTSLYLP
jgi:hypothetical protein